MEEELFFTCPYCWQSISMIFDITQPVQDYIEDCEVCCRPIQINLTPSAEEPNLEIKRLDE